MKKEVGLVEKISFGLGDFALNGIFTFVSTYLMFYYTDVACLDLSAISLIILIGRVVDAICSPIMGAVIDKTHSKYGKCRPYVAAAIFPACILMIVLFSIPSGLSEGNKVLMSIGVYVLFSICYPIMNVPYSTLLNVLTDDNDERISFNLFKNAGANVGATFVTAVALKLVAVFSKGGKNGFTGTSFVLALLFLVVTVICVRNIKERVSTQSEKDTNLKESLKVVAQNRPWKILCVVQFLSLAAYIIRNQGTIYYAKYYLENESVSSLMLSMTSVIAFCFSFLLPSFVKKHGLRFCVIVGNICWSLSMVGTWFAGKNVVLIVGLHVLTSIGWSMATGMVFVILTQTIDYGQWKTGKRPQGLLTSLLTFVQKIGVALAGVLCSVILNLGHYVANQAAGPSALLAIKIMFGGIPLTTSIICMILMSFYHLDELYPQIEKNLKNGVTMENKEKQSC